jgi:AraC-like DNA-binding protein/quercetin dioxygenase-like cupin family protein
MRHRLSRADEPHFIVRSLAIDYDAGGQEDIHAHPWPQFLYVQTGALRASIDDQFWTLPTRRGLWIPAHTPHCLSMSSRLQLRTLYLPPQEKDAPQGVCVVPVSGLLHETVLRVCAQGVLDRRVELDRCLAMVIRAEITFRDPGGFTLLQPKDKRARKLADFFFDATRVGVPLDALCERAGLSRRTAERIFQAECGLSPAQWRRLAALSEGLVSIAGGATIDQAAIAAGYQSRSAFSEAFSKAFGFPPSEARRQSA